MGCSLRPGLGDVAVFENRQPVMENSLIVTTIFRLNVTIVFRLILTTRFRFKLTTPERYERAVVLAA
jgi:hypothetical protein